ncbi:hypothetical protein NQ314_002188 [Rhamnusium bicolor]|uniref:MADF domain-containing protein n=1 Tax=Rhamnusium bicolor TaxID=1586634 RepID=A0AAV8ZT66_9CUCU|nr:hypothetical protein NQ314_002188 [Rhamnusium bicolor]
MLQALLLLRLTYNVKKIEKGSSVEYRELYKSFPRIWKVKCKEYSDRNIKSQAYEILVEKIKDIDADANRETVVKKINYLRTTYREE